MRCTIPAGFGFAGLESKIHISSVSQIPPIFGLELGLVTNIDFFIEMRIIIIFLLINNKKAIMMSSIEKWTLELDTLFIANRMQLRRAAYKILGDWERSDDIVQDAYIKVAEMTATQDVRQPLSYLFRIVRNLAIDHYRRGIFESQLFGLDEEGINAVTSIDSPENTAMNRQLLERVTEVLAKLPYRTKQVFELYRVNEYTQTKIAEELGISTSLTNTLIREVTDECRNVL